MKRLFENAKVVYLRGFVLTTVAMLAACSQEAADNSDTSAAQENLNSMAEVHANDTSDPSPASEGAPARTVISEELPYGEVNNELVYGHFALPEDMVEPLPAVIVIHEWWGLNDNIRAMADRLAGEGYIVLAVDLFGGEVAESPADARLLMQRAIENPDAAISNLEQALAFVEEVAEAPGIATLGWCFGGGWSLNAALRFPSTLDAAVIYYGQVTDDPEKLEALSSPVLGFFGAEDRGIRVDSVRAFETALDTLDKDATIYVYPGVGHAFANPTGRNYDATAAEDAWAKTLDFLNQELVSSASEEEAGSSEAPESEG